MVIGLITLTINLPVAQSLKDKRSVIKGLMAGIGRQFELSCAEVADHDLWHSAVIACVGVAAQKTLIEPRLHHAVSWVEHQRSDFELLEYRIEFI